jgi:hypothetical protein
VEKCPLAGDVVCDYRAAAVGIITDADRLAAASAGGDSCWFTPIDTIERLNRCIPQPEVTKHRSWYCEEYDMHYRQEGSWVVESTAKAVFGSQVGVWSSVNTWIKGRCIAEDGQVQSEFLTKETCEATAQPVTIPACPASRKCTENDCNGKIVEKTVEVETEAVGTASLLSSLVSTTRMLTEAMQDVQTLKSHILTIGAGASVVVAFSLIIFLRIFAGVAVWTIICLLWLAVLLLDMYAFIQAGDFFGIDLSNATTALQSHIFLEEGKAKDVLDDQLTASEEYAALWQLASYVLLLLVVIYFFIVCVLADKIALCIKIIRNSGKFITHVPTVVFVPAFVFIWIIVWASLFLGIAIAVSTVGDLSIADVGAAYNAATKFKCPEGESEFSCIRDRLAISSSGFANSTSGLDNDINNKMRAKAATMASTGISLESELMRPMLAFTGFMFLWTTAATTGFGVVCMATTVATIYWEPARDGAQWSWKSACCTVITATKEVARYHFGSICFGALVVSIAQTIRLVVSYWMRQAEHLREMHKFVHYAMKVCACCLWCLEKIVKYLTKNAYIVMAITGQNFLCSAWGAFKLVAANPLRVFLVQSIANIIVLLGKLVITGFVTGGFFFYISNGEQFKPGGSHEITSPIAPTIFVGLLSFFVASAFMAAYDCATDTLLLSFLLDEKYAKTLGSSYKIHASAHGMDTFMDSMGATQEDEVRVCPRVDLGLACMTTVCKTK